MKISVIMVDGGFRENVYGARSFASQDFPDEDYEVLWVDFYDRVHPDVVSESNVRSVSLKNHGSEIYHSSYCFNEGIRQAKGEVLVIVDGDLLVRPDFLSQVWNWHERYDRLAIYGYRYNEPAAGVLRSHDWDELERGCTYVNGSNYGACIAVRKRWLLEINGYEQHPVFASGFHSNGYDIYLRLRMIGCAVQWEPSLKLYHVWHPFSLSHDNAYKKQRQLSDWRFSDLNPHAFLGLDESRNLPEHMFPQLQNESWADRIRFGRWKRTLRNFLGQ